MAGSATSGYLGSIRPRREVRVEHARTLLATMSLGTKTIAARSGFGSAPRMARAFERVLGIAPREYRARFS
jgi:transcriptional regulator GlxA family with amidase domain